MSVFSEISVGLRETITTDGLFYRCPPLFDEFVVSRNFLGQPPLFELQKRAVFEPLGTDPALYFSPDKLINVIILEWGKGSGKDLLVSYLIAYFCFLLLEMRDMRGYLGMPADEPVDILTVASSQKQSTNILFAKLVNWLSRPLFKQFNPTVNASDVAFPAGLRLFAFHSRADSWEGYSPIMWALAEASAFRDAAAKSNAEKVFKTLQTSARSRYLGRSIGYVTSYPRSAGDFIKRKVEEAKGRAGWWANTAPSWVVRDDRERRDYQPDFDEDPKFAACVYECDPAQGYGQWFGNRDALDSAFESDIEPEVWWSAIELERDTPKGLKCYVGVDVEAISPRGDSVYFAHGDPGWKDDSFSFVIGRAGDEVHPELGLTSVEITAIILWEPDVKRDLPVDFINVAEVVIELHERFNFEGVTFDQFNSAMLIQRLEEKGVPADDLTFSGKMQLAMYRNLRTLFNQHLVNLIECPKALEEARKLEKRRGRPDHPDGGSKDVVDGIASVSFQLSKAEETNGMGAQFGWA